MHPSCARFSQLVERYWRVAARAWRRFPVTFNQPQQAALATLFLRIHEYGYLINEIFAGLWLFPFGILVFRSVFLPA